MNADEVSVSEPDESNRLHVTDSNKRRRQRRGTGMVFPGRETVTMLREVLKRQTHIATYITRHECFQDVENVLNANKDFTVRVDGKSLRDRYKRMQKIFELAGKRDAMRSDLGEEIYEDHELLSIT